MPQIYHEGKFIGDGISGHNVYDSSGTMLSPTKKIQFNGATVENVDDKTVVTVLHDDTQTGHTIIDSSGTSMNSRNGLQFNDMSVTDDPTNDKTTVSLNTVPISKGGTGATSASAARTNLGLGSLATKSAVSLNSSDTSGVLPISNGGTGNTVGYIQTGQKSGTTIGSNATIEGINNVASQIGSHTEGAENIAAGSYSHAEGYSNTASGNKSHAGGSYNIVAYDNQTAIGKYNSNKSTTLFEVGNGTNSARSNAFEVYNDGHINAAGAYYYKGDQLFKKVVQSVNMDTSGAVETGYTFTFYDLPTYTPLSIISLKASTTGSGGIRIISYDVWHDSGGQQAARIIVRLSSINGNSAINGTSTITIAVIFVNKAFVNGWATNTE